jgi:N-methylhydantoinase A
MRFAIDTGGTFTDLIVEDETGVCRMFKARTTPADPINGVLDALSLAADGFGCTLRSLLSQGTVLVHGTTHAINAIITGRTARTAFLTTEGHRDMLVLREGGRSDPFNFTEAYPPPYIPRSLSFEVRGRIRPDGSVLETLDEAAVMAAIGEMKRRNIEAVAVCLLWSIVNSAHEERVGELLSQHLPGIPFTLSHRLNPAIREFRRASSAAIDASLKPMMGDYMRNLEKRLSDAGFRGRTLVVTSQAGVIDARDAAEAPIHIVNSGPSMAPVAGRYFAGLDCNQPNAIVADTGGTTYDVSLVRRGRIPTTRETWIGPQHRGIMIGFPWVDVRSVGAGGGSIAWIDPGGLLHVGPKSAGASPGPAAYGRGGAEPTVTDASIVLGHLDPDYFLGGAIKLDRALAEAAVQQKVAAPLDVDLAAAADAIIAVITEKMVQAIMDITVNQGIDPREAILVGGGGAAGLNSVRIARRLGCRKLLIPESGAALSAAGALLSDLRAEYHAAFFASTATFDHAGVASTLEKLNASCRAFLEGPGGGAAEKTISYKVAARYSTQVWEIEVPLRGDSLANASELADFVVDFNAAHKDLFSFADPASPIEITGWTAQASCRFAGGGKLHLSNTIAENEDRAPRRLYFRGPGWLESPVYRFERIDPERKIIGPAIVENSFTTVVIESGASAERLASGSLLIDVEAT